MRESTKSVLRAVAGDDTLFPSEVQALIQFAETGLITFMRLEGSLLLNSKNSSEFLGVSTDSFGDMKKQASVIGLKELCGQEVTPDNYMFSRISLARFAAGDLSLNWPKKNRIYPPPHRFGMSQDFNKRRDE